MLFTIIVLVLLISLTVVFFVLFKRKANRKLADSLLIAQEEALMTEEKTPSSNPYRTPAEMPASESVEVPPLEQMDKDITNSIVKKLFDENWFRYAQLDNAFATRNGFLVSLENIICVLKVIIPESGINYEIGRESNIGTKKEWGIASLYQGIEIAVSRAERAAEEKEKEKARTKELKERVALLGKLNEKL